MISPKWMHNKSAEVIFSSYIKFTSDLRRVECISSMKIYRNMMTMMILDLYTIYANICIKQYFKIHYKISIENSRISLINQFSFFFYCINLYTWHIISIITIISKMNEKSYRRKSFQKDGKFSTEQSVDFWIAFSG